MRNRRNILIKTEKKSRVKKIGKIVILCVTISIAVFAISTFLLLHNYINKMRLVHNSSIEAAEQIKINKEVADNTESMKDSELDVSDEKSESNLPNSPEEEIKLLEAAIRKNMEDNSIPIENDDKVLNILLIGSDTRDQRERGRSDSMILISFNKKTKKIIATSFLRDIYLKIPGKRNNRVNSAYSLGGADLLMDTIEKNFKIRIDRYVSVDFQAFIEIVDKVGGVTIDVSKNEIKEINAITGDDMIISSGAQLLNGRQALGYSRIRSVGFNDFDRTARQRKVLEQLFHKLKGLNLIQINDLLNKMLPQVTTNFSEGEIFYQILSLPSYIKYDMQQWCLPEKTAYKDMRIRGMAVLGINFENSISKLRKRIYQED